MRTRRIEPPPSTRARDGVFTRGEALDQGVGSKRILGQVRAGHWVPLAPGVLAARDAVDAGLTPRARCFAAHLATGGVVSHETAAAWYGLTTAQGLLVLGRVDVRLATAEVFDHRIRIGDKDMVWSGLRPPEVLGRPALGHLAFPLTTVVRTVVDCAAWLTASEGQAIGLAAVQRRLLTVQELDAYVARMPQRRGSAKVRDLLRILATGAHSPGEVRLHQILERGGLRGWRANVEIRSRGRLLAVADVLFEAERLIVEFDGRAYHEGDARFQRDRSRDRLLIGLGYTELRFTWEDGTLRPERVAAEVELVLRQLRPA